MPHGVLGDLTVVFAASFPILFLCRKLRLPPVLGFLITGVAIGPHALHWVRETERVTALAELGVVLILFFVGLEFPMERLRRLGRAALVGGTAQLGLTVLLVAGGFLLYGERAGAAVFYGILVSLSSTAVVLPVLAGRDELAAPHARRFLGIALYQDLAVIPLILLLPALAGGEARGVLAQVGLALGGVVLLVVAARFAVPRILHAVVRLGSREGFTAAAIVLVLVMVSLSERAGVSAAMGAFVAGIVVAESEFIHDIASALSPFRDVLSSLFFVSIGMLLDPLFVARYPGFVALAVALVLLVKTGAAFLALRVSGTVPRTALRAALALANVGEFSFVLARAGGRLGLLNSDAEQMFVAVAVITLALAPLLLALAPRLAEALPDRVEAFVAAEPKLASHVVVAGYGLNGQNVARVLQVTHIPHIVVDADSDRVAAARRAGSHAICADATGLETLHAVGIERAVGLVVATSDPEGTRRVVRLSRQRNAALRIIVRTRYLREVDALRAAGADEVIPEEFETSIEIVARILRVFHLPGNVVAAQIRLLRDEAYLRLREEGGGRREDGRRLAALVAAGTSELFLVMPDGSAEGRTLAELHLEADHVSVPALLRDAVPFAPPPQDQRLAAGDTLLLVGAHEDLARVVQRLEQKIT